VAVLALLAALAGKARAAELALPPSAETAKAALDASPRHGEFVEIALPNSETKLRTWVAYPERADKAPVVLVIHEIFGLSDWIMAVADHLAGQGFISVAPDFVSGMPQESGPRDAIGKLTDADIVARANAAREYAVGLPAANGKVAVMGFCWGGRASFLYATAQPKLDAAVVYYGASPTKESLAGVQAPVLGLYGQMDNRVNSTIGPAEAELKHLGKSFEYEIYDGAGHGFLRQQSGQDGANLAASQKAWAKTVEFLREHTGSK
jgi:carboxymethylenebutenolidase